MPKKQPTKKWTPVFKTERRFTAEKVKDIFKKSQVTGFSIKQIKDPEHLAERLNEINISHHNFKHWNQAPASAKVRDELERLQELSKKYHETLTNLSFPAKIKMGLNDPDFFDSLQYNVLGLKIEAEKAIQSIKTKPGRGIKSRSTVIIELSVIYKEVTGRNPGRSRSKGKPSGPFFRFVRNCLDHIDPSEQIGDESLMKAVQKALSLHEKYSNHAPMIKGC